jgi:iron complex outermembrane receptor protein
MGGAVVAFGDESEVGDPWTATSAAGDGGNTSDEKTKGINGEIAWNAAFGAMTIVPSYSTSESEGTRTEEVQGAPGQPSTGETETSNDISENTQKSVEMRIASPQDFFFDWIFGANYYESYDERTKDYEDPDTIDTHSINTTESKALYGNITYPLTDSFRATIGYRHSWDETENNSVEANGPGGVSDGTPTISNQEYSNPDTKIGFEYDLSNNSMIYIDRSTSFRVNGMGMVREDSTLPDPEELVSYSLGAKNRFLDNKLQVNISAFYYDYKNKQANQDKVAYAVIEKDLIAEDGTVGIDLDEDGDVEDEPQDFHDQNSQGYGDFESYGVDLQTNWVITSKDKLDLSISYLHSEWTELLFDYQYDILFDPEDFSGMENIYAPTWTITASYDHNFTLWNGGNLTGHVDGTYKSDFILSWKDDQYPYNYQEAHSIWNASLRYNHPGGHWSLNTYVKNIFEYAVKTSYMDKGGSYQMMIGDPRTFGVVFSFYF